MAEAADTNRKLVDEPTDKTEIFFRQIKAKLTHQGQTAAAKPNTVTLAKMTSLGSGYDRFMLYLAWSFSFFAGILYPLFIIFMGEVIDSFKPDMSAEETLE